MNTTTPETVIAATRQWLEQVVVGLNLCPFARKPLGASQVHFAVSDSRNVETLLVDLSTNWNGWITPPPSRSTPPC